MNAEQVYKDPRVSRVDDNRGAGLGLIIELVPGCHTAGRPVQQIYADNFRQAREMLRDIQAPVQPEELDKLAAWFAGRPFEGV